MAKIEKKVWASKGLANLPNGVRPFDEFTEKIVLSNLINGLNSSLALDLDPEPSLDRSSVDPPTARAGPIYVVVGSSHASRTAVAIRDTGNTVVEVNYPGWRPITGHISSLCATLKKTLEDQPPGRDVYVVFQLLDNCFYFARSEDGSMLPARKGHDGRFHVDGENILAPKEMQYRTFKQILPVLDLARNYVSIIIPPIPRYYNKACCGDKDHCPNMQAPDYKNNLEAAVHEAKGNIKDFCFRHSLRDCKVLAAWTAIKKNENLWLDCDPVHMAPPGYKALAKLVVECQPNHLSNLQRRPSTGPSTNQTNRDARGDSSHTSHGGRGGHYSGDRSSGGPPSRGSNWRPDAHRGPRARYANRGRGRGHGYYPY